MSFISKRYVIKIPSEICVIYNKTNDVLLIKTQNKTKMLHLNVKLLILKEKNYIIVTNQFTNRLSNKIRSSIQGNTVSLIKQTLIDVQVLTHRKLKLVGVGYKVFEEFTKSGQKLLNFKLGYSHSLFYRIPSKINVNINQSIKLFLSGESLFNISQCASVIRKCKKPEPYKGKGILYSNEIIQLKEGKKV